MSYDDTNIYIMVRSSAVDGLIRDTDALTDAYAKECSSKYYRNVSCLTNCTNI